MRKTRRLNYTRKRRSKRGGSPFTFVLLKTNEMDEETFLSLHETNTITDIYETFKRTDDEFKENPHGEYVLFTIEAATKKVLCHALFKSEPDRRVAYLDLIQCPRKSEAFKPISYVAIHKLVELLDSANIGFIYLTVSPRVTDYKKLFNLYSSMGFHCLPSTENLATPKFFAKIFQRARTSTFLRAPNRSYNDYLENCMYMIGMTSNIKSILAEKLVRLSE
jgi:hypothetical protein